MSMVNYQSKTFQLKNGALEKGTSESYVYYHRPVKTKMAP